MRILLIILCLILFPLQSHAVDAVTDPTITHSIEKQEPVKDVSHRITDETLSELRRLERKPPSPEFEEQYRAWSALSEEQKQEAERVIREYLGLKPID